MVWVIKTALLKKHGSTFLPKIVQEYIHHLVDVDLEKTMQWTYINQKTSRHGPLLQIYSLKVLDQEVFISDLKWYITMLLKNLYYGSTILPLLGHLWLPTHMLNISSHHLILLQDLLSSKLKKHLLQKVEPETFQSLLILKIKKLILHMMHGEITIK